MSGIAVGRVDGAGRQCHALSRGFATLSVEILFGSIALLLGLIFGLYLWDWIHPATQTLGRSERLQNSVGSEPFAVSTNILSAGAIAEKWSVLQLNVRNEMKRVAACRGQRSECADVGALRFLRIVEEARTRQGLARLGEVNRAINLAIRPVSDLKNFGEADVWSAPLSTLARGSGDCEDYAIAKMGILLETGTSSQDLRLVILRSMNGRDEHAVLAVRRQGHWLILDNRTLIIVTDVELRGFQAIFIVDQNGARVVAS